ncbi:MAG: hypothetical protein SGCHY_002426 [Lobulomycetales sp.]
MTSQPLRCEEISVPAQQEAWYRMEIRQQPARSRACGPTDYTRNVDPPPIVELLLVEQGSPNAFRISSCPANLLIKAELWDVDGKVHVLKAARVSNESQLLKGEVIVSGEMLSLTEQCEYRFKFVMIDFDAGEQGPLKLGSIFSEPFKDITGFP